MIASVATITNICLVLPVVAIEIETLKTAKSGCSNLSMDGGLFMDAAKRQRLEKAGWSVGTAADFLELSPEESAFIELKLALSKHLKQLRMSQQLSQQALAQRIKSSQSRVAKMEAGDPSASVDLLIRTLLSVGATRKDIAEAIALGLNQLLQWLHLIEKG